MWIYRAYEVLPGGRGGEKRFALFTVAPRSEIWVVGRLLGVPPSRSLQARPCEP